MTSKKQNSSDQLNSFQSENSRRLVVRLSRILPGKTGDKEWCLNENDKQKIQTEDVGKRKKPWEKILRPRCVNSLSTARSNKTKAFKKAPKRPIVVEDTEEMKPPPNLAPKQVTLGPTDLFSVSQTSQGNVKIIFYRAEEKLAHRLNFRSVPQRSLISRRQRMYNAIRFRIL